MTEVPADKKRHQIEWTQEQFDLVLNTILTAESQEQFLGMCSRLAPIVGKSAEAVERIVWGIATRISSNRYEPGPTRLQRVKSGYMDVRIVQWSYKSRTKDEMRKFGPADLEHLQRILCLPMEVVQQLWHQHGPAKGRKGFFDGD